MSAVPTALKMLVIEPSETSLSPGKKVTYASRARARPLP